MGQWTEDRTQRRKGYPAVEMYRLAPVGMGVSIDRVRKVRFRGSLSLPAAQRASLELEEWTHFEFSRLILDLVLTSYLTTVSLALVLERLARLSN
jgi:hypothetical protein